jgi:hypothetical protein
MGIQPEDLSFGEEPLTVEFLDQDEKALFHSAMFREELIDFLESELGQLIRAFAQSELRQCKQELLQVRPWRKRKISAIQQRAAVAQQQLNFFARVLTEGELAYQAIKQYQSEYHD